MVEYKYLDCVNGQGTYILSFALRKTGFTSKISKFEEVRFLKDDE